MKKLITAIALILVLLVAGCSNDGDGVSTENSTIQKVLKEKKLVVGIAPGYFPFEMKSTNKDEGFIGYDIDLANAIGKSLKVEVEFKQFPFDSLPAALQTGDVDMLVAGMTITGERALAMNMSNPYYQTGQAVMVPASDTATKSWKDLDVEGKKIAVGVGTTGALLAKDIFENAEILDFEDFPLAAMATNQGQADAVIYDEPAIAVWKLQHEGKVRQVEELISYENLGIAVKKNDYETTQWLNSFLNSYIDSPEELASRKQWFDTSDWLNKVEEGE